MEGRGGVEGKGRLGCTDTVSCACGERMDVYNYSPYIIEVMRMGFSIISRNMRGGKRLKYYS